MQVICEVSCCNIYAIGTSEDRDIFLRSTLTTRQQYPIPKLESQYVFLEKSYWNKILTVVFDA
jgi:hypothetical protein